MFRRLTGLLILLSFLWIKGGMSFDFQSDRKVYTIHYSNADGKDQPDQHSEEDQKESKLLELADEFIDNYTYTFAVLPNPIRKRIPLKTPQILGADISIPSPPPNLFCRS